MRLIPYRTGRLPWATLSRTTPAVREGFLYGDTRRHVLALRVVTINGEVHSFKRGEAIDFDTEAAAAPEDDKTFRWFSCCNREWTGWTSSSARKEHWAQSHR